MKPNLSILIIGSGSIGQRHKEIASHYSDNVRLLGSREYLNLSAAEVSQLASQYAALKRLSVLIVATPEPFHLKVCSELGMAFYRVLVEKPLGSGFESISEELRQKIWVGYCLRFHPLIVYAREFFLLKGAKVRSCELICLSDAKSWRQTNWRDVVTFNKFLGGGSIKELSHEIDLAFFLWQSVNIRCERVEYGIGELDSVDLRATLSGTAYNAGVYFPIDIKIDIASSQEERLIKIFDSNNDLYVFNVKESKLLKNGSMVHEFNTDRNAIFHKQFEFIIGSRFQTNVPDALSVMKVIAEC